MRTLLIVSLTFVIGLVSGQKLMTIAYDPVTIENNVIQNIKVVYATGCAEGIRIATGKVDTYIACLDLAEKTVKDQEEIIRNKIWKK